MPELPEVETIRRALALELPGLRVDSRRGAINRHCGALSMWS